ncbi:MAG: urease accessory protein UreF [Rhizobiaceae bacterium]
MAITTRVIIITIMTSPSLIQLMTLLSPTFPVGGFAYSAGLEAARQNRWVNTADELESWITTSLNYGTLHNDTVLLSATCQKPGSVAEINQLAISLCGSETRYLEATNLGNAFVAASTSWYTQSAPNLPDPIAYPVAVGAVSTALTLPRIDTLQAFLQSTISNQIQIAIRLMSFGQRQAMELLHRFEPAIETAAQDAQDADLTQIGTSAITMEIATLQHETLPSRIFRS